MSWQSWAGALHLFIKKTVYHGLSSIYGASTKDGPRACRIISLWCKRSAFQNIKHKGGEKVNSTEKVEFEQELQKTDCNKLLKAS